MKTFKQFLMELYNEPEDSTFGENGRTYDLNGILSATLGMEVKEYPVNQLIWIFKYDNPYNDKSRIIAADLNAPILITKEGSKFVVIDGLHRLAKAERNNKPTIKGILVTRELLDRYQIRLNEDAPANSVGGGNIAGLGVGPQGEPGIKKTKKFKGKGLKWYGNSFNTK
jgi:hypothetical protein